MCRAAIALAAAALLTPAFAHAEPWPLITPVTSPVYETPGDVKAITSRGATCLARTLKPGFTTAPTILSTDLDGGQVVANNAYETPGLLGQPMPSRSKVTFEAKPGRFRLVFSEMEEMPTPQLGWMPLRGRRGPDDAPRTLAILNEIAERVADCVKQSPAAEDW